jgi:acetyl/propionyl-CoA carboxylase alpha subunit
MKVTIEINKEECVKQNNNQKPLLENPSADMSEFSRCNIGFAAIVCVAVRRSAGFDSTTF